MDSKFLTSEITLIGKDEWGHSIRSRVIALWDTGTENCAIKSSLAKKLNLQRIGFSKISTVAAVKKLTVYTMDIELTDEWRISSLHVFSTDLLEADVILGLSVIKLGDFHVSNENGNTYFSYSLAPDSPEDD